MIKFVLFYVILVAFFLTTECESQYGPNKAQCKNYTAKCIANVYKDAPECTLIHCIWEACSVAQLNATAVGKTYIKKRKKCISSVSSLSLSIIVISIFVILI
jgi:hypothetical protein